MDPDPELDVTLSNGRRVVTFQITALDRDLGTWTVDEPFVPRRVILGDAEALALRRRVDARIAARLAGWVPVDGGPAGVPATALPADLALQVSSLLEALTRGREALRTADPTGQLWAACLTFLQQAQRFGVAAPATRRERAQRERRLGELAEQAGDVAGAILHYRAALAAGRSIGVRRRLAQLHPDPSATKSGRVVTRGVPSRRASLTGTVQLACRIDRTLHARVHGQAARTGLTVRTLVIHALAHATAACGTRPRSSDGARRNG